MGRAADCIHCVKHHPHECKGVCHWVGNQCKPKSALPDAHIRLAPLEPAIMLSGWTMKDLPYLAIVQDAMAGHCKRLLRRPPKTIVPLSVQHSDFRLLNRTEALVENGA